MSVSSMIIRVIFPIFFIVSTAVIILFQTFFISDFLDANKGIVVVFISGILALLVALVVIADKRILDKNAYSVFATLSILASVPLLFSLIGGITPTELKGFGFEVGTVIFFFVVSIIFVSGYLYGRINKNITNLLLTMIFATDLVLLFFVVGFLQT